jgi:hypothetical protein
MLEIYEEFVRQEAGKKRHSDVLFARYNGINESQGFKSPDKLPALLYFKRHIDSDRKLTGEEKDIITFEGMNSLLSKSS